jgi:hypothetical protein
MRAPRLGSIAFGALSNAPRTLRARGTGHSLNTNRNRRALHVLKASGVRPEQRSEKQEEADR